MLVLFALTAHEGRWAIRVEGPHVPGGQRHVHVQAKGLSGQYSWNVDGSRHDEHRFPPNEKWLGAAKRLAAKKLGIPESRLSLIGAVMAVREIDLDIHYDGQAPGPKVTLSIEQGGRPGGLVVLSGRAGRIYMAWVQGDEST